MTENRSTLEIEKSALPDALALIKELHELRARLAEVERERDALKTRENALRRILEAIHEHATNNSHDEDNVLCIQCDYARAMADEALKALSGGAS